MRILDRQISLVAFGNKSKRDAGIKATQEAASTALATIEKQVTGSTQIRVNVGKKAYGVALRPDGLTLYQTTPNVDTPIRIERSGSKKPWTITKGEKTLARFTQPIAAALQALAEKLKQPA